MKLSELLKIPQGLTAVIGGGGKTTMLAALGRELSRAGTVIITTTTHMLPYEDMRCILSSDPEEIAKAVKSRGCIQVGELNENGKLSPLRCEMKELLAAADYVLCEADGSRGLPVKAHLKHEPVIPEESALVIEVMGANGFLKPVRSVCHRPERFAALTGAGLDDPVTPGLAAGLLMAESLSDAVFINQAESPEAERLALEMGGQINRPLYYGSLKNGVWKCAQ